MRKYILGMAVIITALTTVSCSDDDDNTLPQVKPTATGTMTDNEGNEYPYVRIGNLEWTAKNANGGEPWYLQSYMTDNDIEYYFEDQYDAEEEEPLCAANGNYYTYDQAIANCPDGWRLPTDDDWKALEKALGMSSSDVEKTGWRNGAAQLMMQDSEGTGLNMIFNGKLCSQSTASYEKYRVGDYGYYWTATIDPIMSNRCAYIRKITPVLNQVLRASSPCKHFLSVRYVRDAK